MSQNQSKIVTAISNLDSTNESISNQFIAVKDLKFFLIEELTCLKYIQHISIERQ